MLKKLEKNTVLYYLFLVLWCMLAYLGNLVFLKIATEKYGYDFPSKQFAFGVAIIAVCFNFIFVRMMKWFDVEDFKMNYKNLYFPNGICTGLIIISGLLVLSFKNLGVTAASSIYKGILVPIGFAVAIKYAMSLSENDKKKEFSKVVAWPQIVSLTIALCAVMFAVWINRKSNWLNWFAWIVIFIYSYSYYQRLSRMKNVKNQLAYAAGEQQICTVTVLLFIGCIQIIAFFLPKEMNTNLNWLFALIKEMQFTIEIFNVKCLFLMVLSGILFGLYAPASILIIMFNKGKVGTLTFGTITHKGVGVAAVAIAPYIIDKLSHFLTGKVAPQTSADEWRAFFMFSLAVIFPVGVEVIRIIWKQLSTKKLVTMESL